MMDVPNQQVKDCTGAAYDYLRNRSDKNLITLQKQLQSLSMINDLEIFEPSSSEILELYLCLEKLLTPVEAKSTVAGKVLALLAHILESSAIRAALRDDIKIVPVLSNFLVNSKLSKDNRLKTLRLLGVISCRIKVVYLEGWIMELVPFLAATVTKGTLGDESPLVALQTLANLCRSNPPVIECLRRLPNNQMLLKTLFLMKNATMYIRLLVLEMWFFIDSKMDDAVFSNNELLDMIFTVAIDGFEENRITWLQLAADVFEELAVMPSLEPIFREYTNYGTRVQLLLGRLSPSTPELLAEALLDFVCCLVKFSHHDIKSLHQVIFSKVTEWIHSQRCGQTAMQVLKELLAAAGTNALTSASMDSFVDATKMCLTSREDSDMTHAEVQHITVILGLVDHISTSYEALLLKFAWKLEPSLFSHLMNKALLLESAFMGGGPDPMMSGERSSADSTSTSGYDSQTGSRLGTPSCPTEGSAVSRYDLKLSLRKILSKAIILILTVIKGLGAVKSEHLTEYRKMMGNPEVMGHLMWGGQSGVREYVTRAWVIISDGSLSKVCLDALVTATEESPSKVETLHGCHTRMLSSQSSMPVLPADFEGKVDTMIARLGGTARKMEFKDCPLTDVMNMYEYKLASLAHSEQSLMKALMKADIQNRQTCLLHLQTNIQNDHLRSLLAKWESNVQMVRAEKSELQGTIEEIKESSRQFKDNFINEKEKLEKNTKDMRKELLALKSSFKATEEKNTKLQQQLSNKVEEIHNQQVLIQEEQEKGLKLSLQVQKLEGEVKQGARSLETLKKEIVNLENIKQQLKIENSDLELLVKSKDEAMATKEEELEEANIKLKSMEEIQNMIHDMSSRKVIK